jgi:hypothetical protein
VIGTVTVSVELGERELWVLVGVLEVSIKEMAEADPHGMGIIDPDREPELQEQRDLYDKFYAALVATQTSKSEHPEE